MDPIPSPADSTLGIKRLRAAYCVIAVRIAFSDAQTRWPDLFASGSPISEACRNCDDLCADMANFFLANGPSEDDLDEQYTRATRCADECEKCAEEAEMNRDARLEDLANACREAVSACHELARILRERPGNP